MGLKLGEYVIEDVEGTKLFAFNHFKQRFQEPISNRPKLDGVTYNELFLLNKSVALRFHSQCKISRRAFGMQLVGRARVQMVSPCTYLKLDVILLNMILLIALMIFILQTHLPKAFSADSIALIPKNHNPQGLNDYLRIYLIGIIYRIISKLLVERLKGIIGKLVYLNQSTFIPKRDLFDGVLVLNELVDFALWNMKDLFMFKVDF